MGASTDSWLNPDRSIPEELVHDSTCDGRPPQVAQSLDDGDRVTTHACDVTDPQQLDQLFAAAVAWRGGVDILVNDALTISAGSGD